ncbi:MAG: hypothetical protein JXA21_17380 [Anaerolineae bacterium]|nr:hypothetical protein [Anaerolineae bacterium]
MLHKKFLAFAQVVGVVTLGLLAAYGVVSLSGNSPVAAALGLRAPQAPQSIEPSVVSYQGMLYDDLGAPLSGAYTLTFRLYDGIAAPVTQTLWTEVITGVTVREGYFTVLLGDSTPIDYADFAQPDTYIGIQVESYDELVPRQRFATVPYAFYASRASGLTAPDGDPADAVTVDTEGALNVTRILTVGGAIFAESLTASGDLYANQIHASDLVSSSILRGDSLDMGSVSISGGAITGDSLNVGGDIVGGDITANGNIGWAYPNHLTGFTVSQEYTVTIHSPDLEDTETKNMVNSSNSICFLTNCYHEIGMGATNDTGCKVYEDGGLWKLEAFSLHALTLCKARCISW